MNRAVVYILDDEPDLVELMAAFLQELPIDIRKFTSSQEFLDAFEATTVGCVLMDMQMPNLTGEQVLDRCRGWLPLYPFTIVSAHADVPMAVALMKKGAFDVIPKPFNRQYLVDHVNKALAWSKDLRERHQDAVEVWTSIQSLTERELEIMDYLLTGLSSREISEKLEISRFTVDHHRAHIMEKLKSPSLSGLTSAVARAKAIFETNGSTH